MTQTLIFLGVGASKITALWLLCGLCSMVLLRCIQARDPTTIVTDSDISGALWWGLFSLICILTIIFCCIVHPISYIPGWIGQKLGISVATNAPYADKGFFAKYLE